jgi:hypothetical protein
MRSRKCSGRLAVLPALGALLGVAAGIATVSWSTAAAGRADVEEGAVFDATHLPPLLRTRSEQVELAYDIHCAAGEVGLVDAGCDVHGAVFVRRVGESAFSELGLEPRSRGDGRQLAVTVPDALAASSRGFEYYATFEAPGVAEPIVLPAGGAGAPHVSRPLGDTVEIELGSHAFGRGRRTGERVASASWGDGLAQVGLEPGRNLDPIGASAFAVDARRNVLLLDQVHHRVLRWSMGAKSPQRVPVSVDGTLADMAVAGDDSIFVLETTVPLGRNPKVRRFDDGGRELEAIEAAERTASQIRIDAHGPVVLGGASHHWLPVVVDGVPASPREQLERGRAGRRFDDGREVVVMRVENELRVALLAGGNMLRSWRLTSKTPLAEVQLAEPIGSHVLVVVRVYEDGGADEFTALVLGRSGLVDRFTLDSADWAETAPLGRFELVGRALYRLGSTPAGTFVDRYDLEVR